MCQMYKRACACGQKTAEIFFGNMILDQVAIVELYCPECSATVDTDSDSIAADNGWALELDKEVLAVFGPRMQLDADTITADQVFDGGFITWVGFTPEDNQSRATEREEIMERTKGDTRQQFMALKQWAMDREKKFINDGWRKALQAVKAA